MSDLGVAGTIGIVAGDIEEIEEWLDDNPDNEIIDIKYSTVTYIATDTGFPVISDRVMIIFLKED